MEGVEIRKLVELEDRHWWYRERRAILAREANRLGASARPEGGQRPQLIGKPGVALDIGAAGGGNTRVLAGRGWRCVAIEYGAEGAAVARERGLDVIRADARHLPVESASFDLVIAMDVLEHIEEDDQTASEIRRVLRPGGTLVVSVPCDMKLWSPHDVALGHVRRYTRESLRKVIEGAGLHVDSLWSWNVLLRPVVRLRRRRMSDSTGSDLEEMSPIVNAALTGIVVVERFLPVRSLPGVSLILRAHRPV